MKTELLAPAKDKETAFTAIDCGADAVYIGASSFGARQNAVNSIEDIKEVIEYAHKYWVKVFITVNTILTDDELTEAVELVKQLDKIGADAILVQDMGLLYKLIELKLDIPIHMSTQCDNRNIKKTEFFKNIGASRVVLARELSLEQIKEIHNANPEIELEGFVHGALCVSYSGQCYLSCQIGGRSANRGECAQPCRKKYSVVNNTGKVIAKDIYALCLKDFNASSHLKEMAKNGIYSFKIEGRLKDIGYVKNITAYYREELDKFSKKSSSGKSFYKFKPNPEKSFNRGFTDYFLAGRGECYNYISPKSMGEKIGKVIKIEKNKILIKTNKELHNQDGLCFIRENRDMSQLEGFIANSVRIINPKSNQVEITPNKDINLNIGDTLYRNSDVEFNRLLLQPTKRQIGINIKYQNSSITLTDEDGISIEFHFNQTEKAKNRQKMNETFIKQFSKTGESDFFINKIELLSDVTFMPVSLINDIRRTCFEELMKKRLYSYKRQKQKPMKLTQYFEKKLDYRANVHNQTAKEFYEKCGAKVTEMSFESIKPKRQVELMRTKHCIKYALNMCKSPQELYLLDEYNVKYPLKFDCKNCEMCVLSPA